MESIFLAEKEVHNIRPLWEKVFAEDSKEFTDYYFANKAERNLVFARADEDKIVSMLHLTPYMTGEMEPVCYIVGVATDEAYRRQGLMDSMLKEALQFMWTERQPFTFLMPANPAYYVPYNFTYIYDKPMWKLNEAVLPARYLDTTAKYEAEFHLAVKDRGTLQIRVAKDGDFAQLSEFANALLKKNADCFLLRNVNYYKLLKKELIAQKGNLFLVEQDNIIKGILAYTKENEKPGLQEVIMDEELSAWQLINAQGYKPAIMARILRVEDFIGNMKTSGPVDVTVQIQDDLLSQNNASFHFYSTSEGKLLCKKRRDAECVITIEDLTAFCFGYKRAEECFRVLHEDAKEEVLRSLEQINVRKRVFINEII